MVKISTDLIESNIMPVILKLQRELGIETSSFPDLIIMVRPCHDNDNNTQLTENEITE